MGDTLDTVAVTWSFTLDNGPGDPDNADTVTVFTEDGFNVATVTRTPRGRWSIAGSDSGHVLTVTDTRRRYGTPEDAVDVVTRRMGVTLVNA